MKIVTGIDVGSSHIKVATKTVSSTGEYMDITVYPLWYVAKKNKISGVERINDLIRATLHTVKRKLLERANPNDIFINLCTSIEAIAPTFDLLTFFKDIFSGMNLYVSTSEGAVPIDCIEKWPKISVVHALSYIAKKFIDYGILVHISSTSSVFIPVINSSAPINDIHYYTGVALWLGAPYSHLHFISNKSLLFGKYILTSPIDVYLEDILILIYGENKIKNILEEYRAPPLHIMSKSINESISRLEKFLGIFPDVHYRNPNNKEMYDIENQIFLSAYYLYWRFVDTISQNLLRVLSYYDIPINKSRIIVSGIGKDFIYGAFKILFGNRVVAIEEIVPKPHSIFLEAYSACEMLYESLQRSDENACV